MTVRWATQVKALVLEHYKTAEVPLLLAALGTELRKRELWPPPGQQRTLASAIEGADDSLLIIRDPQTPTYMAVATLDTRSVVESAIAERSQKRFLSELARPILLAFCKEGDRKIFVRREPPFRYYVGEPPDVAECVEVSDDYRMPGLYVDDPAQIPGDVALELAKRVRAWAADNSLNIENFFSEQREAPKATKAPSRATALERLLAAQPSGVASRMVVPLDIAVQLSRQP
ncbi:MAG TPA: hypothetical protein VL358_06625 [Caulobacteraceae bacterium]|nr:hypothetical protein [Caulobacteraceae bacterium]